MMALTRDLMRMPKPWVTWVLVLMVVNLGGGLAYLGTLEGRVVLVLFLVAAMLLMALHRLFGFVRLLGLAHFVWFPLVGWLYLRLDEAPPVGMDDTFRTWLWAVIVLNSLSLAIDVVDVVRYLRGERAPTV